MSSSTRRCARPRARGSSSSSAAVGSPSAATSPSSSRTAIPCSSRSRRCAAWSGSLTTPACRTSSTSTTRSCPGRESSAPPSSSRSPRRTTSSPSSTASWASTWGPPCGSRSAGSSPSPASSRPATPTRRRASSRPCTSSASPSRPRLSAPSRRPTSTSWSTIRPSAPAWSCPPRPRPSCSAISKADTRGPEGADVPSGLAIPRTPLLAQEHEEQIEDGGENEAEPQRALDGGERLGRAFARRTREGIDLDEGHHDEGQGPEYRARARHGQGEMAGRAHEEEHGNGESDIGAGGEPAARARGGRGGIGGLARRDIDGVLDDDLVLGPDHEPDIRPHDGAENAAHQDDPGLGIREAALAEPVVQEVDPAAQEGEHGGPAEPPEGAGQQLLLRAAAHGGFRLSEEGHLDEIEVIEQADPGDAREEVDP